jgi:hypothetical protein
MWLMEPREAFANTGGMIEKQRRMVGHWDMRRSGAVDAGGGSIEDQSNEMANTVDRSKRLCKASNPVNLESVRRFDPARAIGAKKLEHSGIKSSSTTPR